VKILRFSIQRTVVVFLMVAVLRVETAAQDRCKEILSDGVWQYQSSTNSTQQTASFLNWFCSKTYSSYNQARDAGLSIGIPVDGLPLEIGGKYRDSQWSEYRNEMCRLDSGQYAYSSQFSVFARQASEAIVKAWEACINRTGTQAWIATTDDPNAFALQIRRRVDIGTPKFTVNQISVTSGRLQCTPTLSSAAGKTYQGSTSFLCQRTDRKQAFTI
jgi:hypothetical protein